MQTLVRILKDTCQREQEIRQNVRPDQQDDMLLVEMGCMLQRMILETPILFKPSNELFGPRRSTRANLAIEKVELVLSHNSTQ